MFPPVLNKFVALAAVAGPVSGARVLIQSQTVSSAVATVDFTTGIDATYDDYELRFYGLTVAANGNLGLRISRHPRIAAPNIDRPTYRGELLASRRRSRKVKSHYAAISVI